MVDIDFRMPSAIEEWLRKKMKENRVEKDSEKVMKRNTLPCPLCQRRTDILFPSGQLMLCPRCARRVMNQSDVPVKVRKVVDLHGEKCYYCGKTFIVGYEVETMICNRCTETIGKRQREIQEFHLRQLKWGVRKLP